MIKEIKQNFKKVDKVLLIISSILFIWGLLSIISASSRIAVAYDKPVHFYFLKQIVMSLVGLVFFFFIVNIPTKKYLKITRILFIVITLILLFLSFGSETRGAQNWITILGFKFQPSEFAKPIIIVYLALLFEIYYNKVKGSETNKYILGVILLVGLFAPIVVFFQKDLGTAIILLMTFLMMFVASPINFKNKLKIMGILVLTSVIGLGIIYFRSGSILTQEQEERFNYFNPCSNYEEGGYQVCNGFIAINNGGLFGLGLGNSQQKYSYIPEPHTDSIFAIVSEENGFIRTSFVFILYILLLYRIIMIASKASSIRGRFIALGVSFYIFLHILINLGGLLGLLPLTGVPLPFFSYGGSYIIGLIVSIGLVERVYIEDKILKI